jgi:hypothetical protein
MLLQVDAASAEKLHILFTIHLMQSCAGVISGPPPCTLSARTVATITTTSGTNPEDRHLMLKPLTTHREVEAGFCDYKSCLFVVIFIGFGPC